MSSPEVLLSLVALRPASDYEPETLCPAWLEAKDRECDRPATEGYLCKRHHNVALKRLERERQRDAERRQQIMDWRAKQLPEWRTRLRAVEAELDRLDPPVPADRAAYTGYVHPSIQKKRASALSGKRVSRLAGLYREAEKLRRLIGANKERA